MRPGSRAALLALALAACGGDGDGGSPAGPGAGPWSVDPAPLALGESAWNPDGAEVGRVKALAELPGRVALFGERGVTVVTDARVEASDPTVTGWLDAAVLPGPDGSGPWAVGLDDQGRLRRVRDQGALDEVSDRYGLEGVAVRAVAAAGPSHVAFGLDDGVAIADGQTVTRYRLPALRALSGGGRRVAGIAPDGGVQVLTTDGAVTTLTVAGARATAVDDAGRVFVASDQGLFVATAADPARQVFAAPVSAVVSAGSRVWFATASEVCLVDQQTIRCTQGAGLAPTRLAPAGNRGVWVLSDGALLRQLRLDRSPDERDWYERVQPIHARACAPCHGPQGSQAEVATYAQWSERRQDIRDRVVVQRRMPPVAGTITEAERAAIGAWAAGAP